MYLSVLLNTRSIGLEAWSKMAQHGHGAAVKSGMVACPLACLFVMWHI